MQIELYNRYGTTVNFECEGKALDIYRTPRQLKLRPGSQLRMIDKSMYANCDGYLGHFVTDEKGHAQHFMVERA